MDVFFFDFSEIGTIQSVREIIAKTSSTPLGAYRLGILHSLDSLSLSATNGLLHLFEEGVEDTYFLCTSSSYDRIIPTLRSRIICIDQDIGDYTLDRSISVMLEDFFQ